MSNLRWNNFEHLRRGFVFSRNIYEAIFKHSLNALKTENFEENNFIKQNSAKFDVCFSSSLARDLRRQKVVKQKLCCTHKHDVFLCFIISGFNLIMLSSSLLSTLEKYWKRLIVHNMFSLLFRNSHLSCFSAVNRWVQGSCHQKSFSHFPLDSSEFPLN